MKDAAAIVTGQIRTALPSPFADFLVERAYDVADAVTNFASGYRAAGVRPKS